MATIEQDEFHGLVMNGGSDLFPTDADLAAAMTDPTEAD